MNRLFLLGRGLQKSRFPVDMGVEGAPFWGAEVTRYQTQNGMRR